MSAAPSVADVRRLLTLRYTQHAIARELGTSRHQVRMVIEAHGLQRTTTPAAGAPEDRPSAYREPSPPRRFSWQQDAGA